MFVLGVQGHWAQLCDASARAAPAVALPPHPLNQDKSMSLQHVIDYFLSRLEPYNPAYDDEETTDNDGPSGIDGTQDTQLLLDEGNEEQQQYKGSTNEQQEIMQQTHVSTEPEQQEREDYGRPSPQTTTVSLFCMYSLV